MLFEGTSRTCTNAFAIETSTGERGFVTAGHCVSANDPVTRERNHPLDPFDDADKGDYVYGSQGDLGWLTVDDPFLSDNFIYDDAGGFPHRDPTAQYGRASFGQYICKYGWKTDRTCDDVYDSSPHCHGSICWLVGMEHNKADVGDSGGPWWDHISGEGTVQYGVHFGEPAGHDHYTYIIQFFYAFDNVFLYYD